MSYKISSDCLACDNCRPLCPTGAIDVEDGQYWINPALCDDCKEYTEPQCIISCPLSLPMPSQAKRGRAKIDSRIPTSPDLFANTKNSPFASALVVWEACNLLAQRQSLLPGTNPENKLTYQRVLSKQGSLKLEIVDDIQPKKLLVPIAGKGAMTGLEAFDIRSACMHLIYAAHATALDNPWEQAFVVSDRQIEEYLGLEKRKDLSKPAKLTLIKEIAQQPCLIHLTMDYPSQGRIPGFSCENEPLWHLLDIHHSFQEDEAGCKHLVGLTFTVRAGVWASYFLNRQGCKERTAFYQYSVLPKSLLSSVMSLWQQHEGAARMMLWVLFKIRMGREQRIMVPTLMRIAYGEERMTRASAQREERKRLIKTFESDLEVLNHYGLKPVFDPETYAPDIQPLWAKLGALPDDAEAALEFWMNDGSNDTRLTDASPRGKWNLLMNARILWFELPTEWHQSSANLERKKQRSRKNTSRETRKYGSQRSPARSKSPLKEVNGLTGEQIVAARKQRGLSQRELAEKTGKSQSWIRDIENGRFCPKAEDQTLLRRMLDLEQ